MNLLSPLMRRTFDVPCTVEIEHSADSLHAHVELADNFAVQPGDEVFVHNAPTDVPFGHCVTVERMATVVRAGIVERAWTKFAGHLELNELYEVSFSDRRRL